MSQPTASGPDQFDPAAFAVVEPRTFEDLKVGDVFIAFTSVSCKFLAEVHSGDTLYPQLELIDLAPHGDAGQVTTRATVHSQHGQLVLDGDHTYLLKTAQHSTSVGEVLADSMAARELGRCRLLGGLVLTAWRLRWTVAHACTAAPTSARPGPSVPARSPLRQRLRPGRSGPTSRGVRLTANRG